MDIQNYINNLSNQWRSERAQSQLTLGGLIEELKTLPNDALIENLTEAHSYRGYYSDLAFEKHEGTTTVGDLLATCQVCLGEVFVGYKGGDNRMEEDTPLWIADYGCCGLKIVAIVKGDVLTFDTEEDKFD